MNPVKVFFLFSLIVGQSVWGSPTFIGEDILLRGAKTGIVDPPPQPKPEFFFPNCRNLSESPNVSLDTILLGEVGLTGEVRSVPMMEMRLKEIAKMNYKRVITSKRAADDLNGKYKLELVGITKAAELKGLLFQ